MFSTPSIKMVGVPNQLSVYPHHPHRLLQCVSYRPNNSLQSVNYLLRERYCSAYRSLICHLLWFGFALSFFHYINKKSMQYTSFELFLVGFCYVAGLILGDYHSKLACMGYPVYLVSKLIVFSLFFWIELAQWQPKKKLI